MGILLPNEAINRRWNGALEARLRRVPLEAFLKDQAISPADAGVAQDSDDLVRATVHMVEAGLARYFENCQGELLPSQYPFVGYLACEVSHALSCLILNPAAWRVASLLSTARLLSPWIGLNAAALHSAKYVREFQLALVDSPVRLDAPIRSCVSGVSGIERTQALRQFAELIARSLSLREATVCDSAERA